MTDFHAVWHIPVPHTVQNDVVQQPQDTGLMERIEELSQSQRLYVESMLLNGVPEIAEPVTSITRGRPPGATNLDRRIPSLFERVERQPRL